MQGSEEKKIPGVGWGGVSLLGVFEDYNRYLISLYFLQIPDHP